MKILSWNLHHQTLPKSIPDDLVELFVALNADVVLLNEFVDGPTRASFRESLRSAGYVYQLVSSTPGKHNQVFAAAIYPCSLGDIAPPSFDGSAVSNFLHIRFDNTPIELVGLRVPAYAKAADSKSYLRQLHAIMAAASSRAIAFAGDINCNPFAGTGLSEAAGILFPGCDLYSVPNPTGAWSYISANGKWMSRIDHVLHTDTVVIGSPTYVTEHMGWVLSGPRLVHPMSDHAALTFNAAPRIEVLTESTT